MEEVADLGKIPSLVLTAALRTVHTGVRHESPGWKGSHGSFVNGRYFGFPRNSFPGLSSFRKPVVYKPRGIYGAPALCWVLWGIVRL